MANTPEGKVKERIKEILKRFDYAYYHMPVQNGMGSPTLDFICCVRGTYVAIEAKAPGKDPTPRQIETMGKIDYAGGIVLLVDGVRDMHSDPVIDEGICYTWRSYAELESWLVSA